MRVTCQRARNSGVSCLFTGLKLQAKDEPCSND